jgi:hypothetical protein
MSTFNDNIDILVSDLNKNKLGQGFNPATLLARAQRDEDIIFEILEKLKDFNNNVINLTTLGTSGPSTLIGSTLNIPQYSSGSSYITSILDTSSIDLDVTAGVLTANFINAAGYITSSSLSPYLTSAIAATTYEPIIGAGTTGQYWRGDKTWQTFPTVGTWGALNYPTWVSGTPFVKMTAAGTFSLDTNTYLTANQNITLSGDITGSGTTAITTTIANGAVDIAMLSATGTPSSTTFLRGDNTWATPAGGGGGTPAGSTGQVQFNNAGSFGASSNLFWDNTNNRLTVGTGNSVSANLAIESTTADAFMVTRSTLASGQAGIFVFNDQTTATAGASFNLYGNAWSSAFARNQAAFGSRQGLLFFSNNALLTGGTSPIDFYPGGGLESQRFVRMKNFGMAMNSAGTTADPVASAILDMNSTTKGFLPPRLTTTQRNTIATPATGLQIYNTTTGSPEFYNGSSWISNGLITVGAVGAGTANALTAAGTTVTAHVATVTTPGVITMPNAIHSGSGQYPVLLQDGNNIIRDNDALRIRTADNLILGNGTFDFAGSIFGNLFQLKTGGTHSFNTSTTTNPVLTSTAGLITSRTAYEFNNSVGIGWVGIPNATHNITELRGNSLLVNNNSSVYIIGAFASAVPVTSTEIVLRPGGLQSHGNIAKFNLGGALIESGGNGTIAPTSILDVRSTTQGFLPPRMTTAQRTGIISPAEGLIVYDLTLRKLFVYTSTWEMITSL